MDETQYSIQLVAQVTGLSAHVIRIWEQRYRVVEPQRTATKRRLHSQCDLERLNLLRDQTQAGQSVGQVAQFPTDILGELVAASSSFTASEAFGNTRTLARSATAAPSAWTTCATARAAGR